MSFTMKFRGRWCAKILVPDRVKPIAELIQISLPLLSVGDRKLTAGKLSPVVQPVERLRTLEL